ncbi:MAG: hypothetical protein M3Q97_07215 [Bacteroidota bacterium]|nr:hypothetical protein [Bacteroidota bacterium]
MKYIYKRFAITIDQALSTYSKKFELDKNVRLVRALQITSDKPEQLYNRGSQRIEISGDELYPEDYDSKLLMSGISVAPDKRFVELGNGVMPGNGEVKVLYKDFNGPVAFSAYSVVLILKCELVS